MSASSLVMSIVVSGCKMLLTASDFSNMYTTTCLQYFPLTTKGRNQKSKSYNWKRHIIFTKFRKTLRINRLIFYLRKPPPEPSDLTDASQRWAVRSSTLITILTRVHSGPLGSLRLCSFWTTCAGPDLFTRVCPFAAIARFLLHACVLLISTAAPHANIICCHIASWSNHKTPLAFRELTPWLLLLYKDWAVVYLY